MRLLLDRCIGLRVKVELERAGHDVLWVGDWAEDPGDPAILARAYEERRVLVTADKDFGGLAIVRGLPHAGMIRLSKVPATEQGAACIRAIEEFSEQLDAGAILTVYQGRVRVRRGAQVDGHDHS